MGQLALGLRDGIAVITFSNPPLQVMTPPTMNALNRMLPQLRSDEVRAIVFYGLGCDLFHPRRLGGRAGREHPDRAQRLTFNTARRRPGSRGGQA